MQPLKSRASSVCPRIPPTNIPVRTTMRFLIFILSVAIFSARAGDSNDRGEYQSVNDFREIISHQSKKVSFCVNGNLDDDNIEDLVCILNIQRGEPPSLVQLVVLTGLPNGRYVRRVLTPEVENDYEGSSSSWFDVAIRNASIYFETHGRTCCEFGSTIYQFKLYKERWRLVGMKGTSGNTASDENSNNDFSKVEDTNMLTGVTNIMSQRGEKITKRSYKRKRGVYLLSNFDFSGTFAQENSR